MAETWLIGSDPACDLVVDQPAVSGRHCRLTFEGKTLYLLEDLGSTNGTFVDGRRLTAPARVTRASIVTLGQLQPMPWPVEPKPPVDPSLKVVRIGREPDNDLVVNLSTVSGYHARAVWGARPGEVIIEDLGSSNGTAIGTPDRRTMRAIVSEHDTIYLGAYLLPAVRVFEALGVPQTSRVVLKVGAEPVVVGRDPTCNHVVEEAFISGRHARLIQRNDGSVVVEDLGSANGVYINGCRIERVGAAQPGDVIRLGSREFGLSVEPMARSQPSGIEAARIDPMIPSAAQSAARAASLAGSYSEVVAESWRAAWDPTWKPVLFMMLGPLVVGLAVASAGFDASELANPSAWSRASQSLAAMLSRLGLGTVGLGLLLGPATWSWTKAGRDGVAGLRGWSGLVSVALALCLLVCSLEWVTFRLLTGTVARGPEVFGLLWLGSNAGLMVGLIVAAVASPRPIAGWVAVAVLALPLWALGGESACWVRLPAWAKVAAGLSPSRWTFEGLLLSVNDAVPPPALASAQLRADLVEPYFPAETSRTGPLAVTLALGAMLLGWCALAGFIAMEKPLLSPPPIASPPGT